MMGRLAILLALVVTSLAFTSPARAGEVCNETSFMVEAAKAWRTATGLTVEGWVSIVPGGCADVGADVATEQYLYARSTTAYTGGVREWRGGLDVCVDEVDFSFEGVADCQALGLEARQFRRLSEGERERAVLVELEDYGDRAEEAGLQRLLQAAGYDITIIDGYAGRRTRRQIAAFQSDTEQDFGADRGALLTALHTAALARNRNAGLRVCNEADAPVVAAVGRAMGDGYEARGWWRIAEGACAHMLSERLTAGEVFVHARLIDQNGGQRLLGGGVQRFCVAPGRFTTAEQDNCAAIGFEAVNFAPIPEPQDGAAALVLTSNLFEEPAP
jgi:uncharacterized membrane protein